MNKTLALVVVLAAAGLVLTGCFGKKEAPQVVENVNKDIVTEQPAAPLEKFTIDTEKSTVGWSGKMVLINKVHSGTIKIKEGRLDFDGAKLVGGRFVLDMSTITNEDQKGAMKDQLETHLKSADFFDVVNNPISELNIKSVSASSTSTTTSDVYLVSADLTIKGITNTIEFPATIVRNGNTVEAAADVTIDRSLWGVKYGSGKFFSDLGDKAVADEIVYTIKLVGSSEVSGADLNAATSTATTTATTSPENTAVDTQVPVTPATQQ